MRKILFFLIVVAIKSYAQDFDPPAIIFDSGLNGNPYLNSSNQLDPTKVQPNNGYQIGFQWGTTYKIDEAMGLNIVNGGFNPIVDISETQSQIKNGIYDPMGFNYTNDYHPNRNNHGYWTGQRPGILSAAMLHFEPTLLIDHPGEFKTRVGDPSDPIFGFKTISAGEILANQTDPNYSRLILRTSDLNGQNSIPVLEDNWPSKEAINAHVPNFNHVSYEGKIWNLSINLRRLNHVTQTNKTTDKVLELEIEYTLEDNQTGIIEFTKVPDVSKPIDFKGLEYNYTPSLVRGHGYEFYDLENNTTDKFEITSEMLPVYPSSQDITLSAQFFCIGSNDPSLNTNDNILNHNPFLIGHFAKDANIPGIKEINIKVKYFGEENIAIDWIRIENEFARYLWRGDLDDLGYTYNQNNEIIGINGLDIAYDVDVNQAPFVYQTNSRYSIKHAFQEAIKRYNDAQDGSTKNTHNLFRFNMQDTEVDYEMFWSMYRYFNLVTNGLGVVRDNVKWPKLYEHYTKMRERWVGIEYSNDFAATFAPYARIGTRGQLNHDIIGMVGGYATLMGEHNKHNIPESDSLNSFYELNAWGHNGLHRDAHTGQPLDFEEYKTIDIEEYAGRLAHWHIQGELELSLYNVFYSKDKYKLYFNDQDWWQYILPGAGIRLEKMENVSTSSNYYSSENCFNENGIINCYFTVYNVGRPQTGFEYNTLMNNALIMGTKGYIIDGYGDYKIDPNGLLSVQNFFGSPYSQTSITNSSTNQEKVNFIFEDAIGGDFITSDPQLDNQHFGKFTREDIVHENLEVDQDRIYLGQKSRRVESKKLFDYIRANETELFDLELEAAYTKGYKEWMMWDPDEYGPVYKKRNDGINSYNENLPDQSIIQSNNPIEDYVSLDPNDWRIRPPGRKHMQGHHYVNHYEPWDSSFFEFTILKRQNPEYDTDVYYDEYYIGILNRRTDPLIYFTDDSDPNNIHSYMRFISSAEMDKFVTDEENLNSTLPENQRDYTYRDMYWKRLGAREISIPINYQPDDNKYHLVQIEEVGKDGLSNYEIVTKREPYNDIVDTVIAQDRNVVVKLQPGEGKILRVRVLKNDVIQGKLDLSHQTKFIVHPLINADGTESETKVIYHVVYFKEIVCGGNSKNQVFYRCSYPAEKNIVDPTTSENILWKPEINVSKYIRQDDLGSYSTDGDCINCDYPDLLVRKVGTGLNTKQRVFISMVCDNYISEYDLTEVIFDIDANGNTVFFDTSTPFFSNDSQSPLTTFIRTSLHTDGTKGRDFWGPPTMSAIQDGNLYAWNEIIDPLDQKSGLNVAFRDPSANPSNDFNSIESFWGVPNMLDLKYHPSLITYTNYEDGENFSTLVWCSYGEPNGINRECRVNYTNIYVNNNQISYGFDPSAYHRFPNYTTSIFNDAVTKDFMIADNQSYSYSNDLWFFNPVIQRYIRDDDYNTDFTYERLVYQESHQYIDKDRIKAIYIINDKNSVTPQRLTFNTPDTYKAYQDIYVPLLNRTIKFATDLSNPYLSVPTTLQTDSRLSDQDQGSFNLSFNMDDVLLIFPSEWRMSSGNLYQDIVDYGRVSLFNIDNNASLGHLAKSDRVNYGSNIWKNRIIYNSGDDILNSTKSFYKFSVDEYQVEEMISIKDSIGTLDVSDIYVNDEIRLWKRPFTFDLQDSLVTIDVITNDTLYTLPFVCDSSDLISLKLAGMPAHLQQLQLHNLDSNTYYNLITPQAFPPEGATRMNYLILNGNGHNFRLIACSQDSNITYESQRYIGGIPIIDTIDAKISSSSYDQIIDLQYDLSGYDDVADFDVDLYPNPTDGIVIIRPGLEYDSGLLQDYTFKIEIIDDWGKEIRSFKVNAGSIIEYDTSELISGNYFILVTKIRENKNYSRILRRLNVVK